MCNNFGIKSLFFLSCFVLSACSIDISLLALSQLAPPSSDTKPPEAGPSNEPFSFSAISAPTIQKANSTFVLNLLGDFPSSTTFAYSTVSGSMAGQGSRINFIADDTFTGALPIKVTATYQGKSIEQEISLGLTTPDPQIVIDQVTELASTSEVSSSGTGRFRWTGRVLNLAHPENYLMGAFQHTPDAFYFMEWYDGTIHSTALPINSDGTFTFTMRRSRRINVKADRAVFTLVPNTVNPYDTAHCRTAGCGGLNDDVSKMRLPFISDLVSYQHLYYSPVAYSHADSQIQFLGRQFSPDVVAGSTGHLVKSFADLEQYALYDQALAIFAFSHAGEKAKARDIILALDDLYISDNGATPELEGGWYFSYNFDGTSSYPAEGDRRVAGAIAWVAMALNYYQYKFTDSEFQPLTKKTLDYLLGQIDVLSIEGQSYPALRFAPVDLPGGSDQSKVYGLEHALDLYSALRYYADLNTDVTYKNHALDIKKFAQKLWTGSKFLAGYYSPTSSFNTEESYLDTQTWSILAMGGVGANSEDYSLGLKHNCEKFFETAGFLAKDRNQAGIAGFYDMSTNGQADFKFVWSEGTIGHIMALQVANSNQTCRGYSAQQLTSFMAKMIHSDGGVAYATQNTNTSFAQSSSVAGSTWYYFLLKGLNPFQIYSLAD
jgi:hypothetical protein